MFQTHGFSQHTERSTVLSFFLCFRLFLNARFEWRSERLAVEWDDIQQAVARFVRAQVFAEKREVIL